METKQLFWVVDFLTEFRLLRYILDIIPDLFPAYTLPNLIKGVWLVLCDDFDSAELFLNQCNERSRWGKAILELKVICRIHLGTNPARESELLLGLNPKHTLVGNLGKAIGLYHNKKYDDALSILMNLQDGVNCVEYSKTFYTAQCFTFKEDYSEAIHWYYKCLKIIPDEIAALLAKTKCHIQKGEFESGIELASRVLFIDGENAEAKADLFYLYIAKSDFTKAYGYYDAIKNSSVGCDFNLKFNAACCCFELEKYDEASEVFEELRKINPHDLEIIRYLNKVKEKLDAI